MTRMQLDLKKPSDIVAARQAAREMARDLGFGSADQTRLATAVSELARNVIQHATEGTCVIVDASHDKSAVILAEVEDHGPGIADVELALKQGFTTGDGLGAGLPGAKRLMHGFSIESEPGHTLVKLKISRTIT